jgi:hypothetical protein
MTLTMKRWRTWISPAARRGRKAQSAHAAWVEKQRAKIYEKPPAEPHS